MATIGQTYDTGALMYYEPRYSTESRYIKDGETITLGSIAAYDAAGVIAIDDTAFDALETAGTEDNFVYGFVVAVNDTTASLVVRHATLSAMALGSLAAGNVSVLQPLMEAQGIVIKATSIPALVIAPTE